MGLKKFLNIYFKSDDKDKFIGLYKFQCLSATVYKKCVQNIHKICNKYVDFDPHPKKLICNIQTNGRGTNKTRI